MSFVSYAQNFEDVLLHRVFGGQETGYYIDVGAYHPVIGSITKAFYDRGWSGINIEPGSVFSELAAARPRDVNLQMAVIDRSGEVAFIEDKDDRGTSHVASDDGHDALGRTVPCDTLQAIVQAHSRDRPVDFVKIDAEGSEAAIVRSTDWRRLRPRVLLLEATLPWSSALANQEWEPILLEHGYVRAYFDGINCFYIPEEEAPALLRHFRVPVNVLDRVVQHDCDELRVTLVSERQATARFAAERDAIRIAMEQETARLAAERDAIRTAMEQEIARLATERNAFRTTMEQDAERLTSERDSLKVAVEAQQHHAARLTAERDTVQAEADHFARVARELEARLQAPVAPAPAPPPLNVAPLRRTVARRAALFAYKMVRPVVRPLAWRFRSFLTSSLLDQLRQLNARAAVPPTVSLLAPSVYPTNDGAAAEMRRLAAEMERTLLTLALERAPAMEWSPAPRAEAGPDRGRHPDHRVAATSVNPITLRLPHGRTTEVEYTAGDLSVAASLRATNGDWEPHVRRYLETVVQPDWICLDIGANLGAHTLSMAVLAHQGQVVAFEADTANFQLLSRNIDTLSGRRAVIEPVHVALWDRPDVLVCGGADELAGCSFVADDMADNVIAERRLRTVVDSDAINSTELHMRLDEVPALPLDTWLEDSPLPRLHLIKLDVEGAEVRVLRGADAALRRYRPILVVEYNPACAETYFGQPPDVLYHELEARFASIDVLEQDGTLTPVPDWSTLETRLASGKGWEDLVCRSETAAPD